MKKLGEVLESLHPLERRILKHMKNNISAAEIALEANMQNVEVMRALQWLEVKEAIKLSQSITETAELEKNGHVYLKHGFPEKRFLKALLEYSKPITMQKVKELAQLDQDELSASIGLLKKEGLINVGKEISITKKGEDYFTSNNKKENILKDLPKEVSSLSKDEKSIVDDLQRRNIIRIDTNKVFIVELTELGKELLKAKTDVDLIDSLTPSVIASGEWENKKFRRYDVSTNLGTAHIAKRHIVNQAISYIRRIWLDMGFKEVTGSFVQPSFWNFDALFTPQDHPARDLQDTFFIEDSIKYALPKETVKKVKATHENGWTTGSKGWQIPWSEQEAQKPVLITHDTYLSAKVLASITKKDLPVKTFQIMKVFRNEAVDWKHLFEFYQVGGIVVGEEANFRNLLGYLKQFFGKMGFTNVRLRPAHFPYTEPSCEIEVFDPKKKEWIELGGSGIFRPEVVKPLLGFECPVLAWGLGLERIVKDYHNIQDLRDIYKNDLKQLKESKIWLL